MLMVTPGAQCPTVVCVRASSMDRKRHHVSWPFSCLCSRLCYYSAVQRPQVGVASSPRQVSVAMSMMTVTPGAQCPTVVYARASSMHGKRHA